MFTSYATYAFSIVDVVYVVYVRPNIPHVCNKKIYPRSCIVSFSTGKTNVEMNCGAEVQVVICFYTISLLNIN